MRGTPRIAEGLSVRDIHFYTQHRAREEGATRPGEIADRVTSHFVRSRTVERAPCGSKGASAVCRKEDRISSGLYRSLRCARPDVAARRGRSLSAADFGRMTRNIRDSGIRRGSVGDDIYAIKPIYIGSGTSVFAAQVAGDGLVAVGSQGRRLESSCAARNHFVLPSSAVRSRDCKISRTGARDSASGSRLSFSQMSK